MRQFLPFLPQPFIPVADGRAPSPKPIGFAAHRAPLFGLAIGPLGHHMSGMTDASHKFAVHSASDGKFYLFYGRKAVDGHEAVAATTYPSPETPQPFDCAAAVIAFAKAHLDATDEDFATHPGDA